jgi:hypothetical protein
MSSTKLRFLTGELRTPLRVIAERADASISSAWAWQNGADVFDADQLAQIEKYVLGRLETLNKVIPNASFAGAVAL